MKIFWLVLLVSCCFSMSFAQIPNHRRLAGFSDQYRSQNTLGEYTFGYNEDHTTGGSFRRETSDRFGNKIGSYGLRVGDGRVRIVNYVADHNGFRTDVISNEPGVQSQNSNDFSKVTKKNIYSILVPGFQYSSEAPHVSFEADQTPSSFLDEAQLQYNSENSNVNVEDGMGELPYQDEVRDGNLYPNQDSFSNGYLNKDVNQRNVYSNPASFISDNEYSGEESSTYTDEHEIFDNLPDDEYKRASDIAIQNDTSDTHMQKGFEGIQAGLPVEDYSKSTESPLVASTDSIHFQRKGKDHDKKDDMIHDLHTYQSKVRLTKVQENTILQHQNSTSPEESTQTEHTTTQSTSESV